jgi:hypothetical protein
MNERTLATGLSLLPFLYVATVLLSLFVVSSPVVLLAFGLSVALSFVWGWAHLHEVGEAVGLSLVLAILIGELVAEALLLGDLAAQITTGILIGLPFVLLALAEGERASIARRTVALAGALVVGIGLLATRAAIDTSATGHSPTSFVEGFFRTNLTQLEGLISIATGTAAPGLPLREALDPTYAALSALAVVGVVLLVLRPRSGLEALLPVVPSRRRVGSLTDRLTLFSGAQRAVFESRSHDEPPTGAWAPGLGAVVIAAIGAFALILAAYLTPLFALLFLTLGVAGILLVLGTIVARRAPATRAARASGTSDAPSFP